MIRRLAAVAGVLLAGAAALPAQERPAGPDSIAAASRAAGQRLEAAVNTALNRVGGNSTWGVLVVSLSNGDTLVARNADAMLAPASTMKLFTSALALDRFGPEGRFETQVLHTGAIADGVLDGDLILRGAGDPSLGGAPWSEYDEAPMERLARGIAASGIARITGAIVGDPSAFDDGKVPDGWARRNLQRKYAARVSALSFNENRVAVLVRPNGKLASISFRPAATGIDVENTVRVVKGSRSASIRVSQDSVLGRVKVSGWIGALSGTRTYPMMVENPELIAAGALRAALADAGVTVDGPAVIRQAYVEAAPLAALPSPPLDQLVARMNGESNNHFAELLFRNVAVSEAATGSATTASSLLAQFLATKVNADSTTILAADGSGLSMLDRVTPRTMVQLLDYARRAPWGAVFERSLPIAGLTETLARRMRSTPAMGNLHAKTGTTDIVASLAGYVTAKNGEDLAFSIIYNGDNHWRAKDSIDRIGAALARFSR
ncbi:MAG: D-alanyl-D-alanine carboxypeptidase/D-alanyl-D-alanine-endopeptidase [Gemmatimonadaceae bacterium]|nr:D-alanyl-D-alanine carboxypeptidase/D-alanyl-D-alanine-endopeptidase [Gemmatimonadaceae bacterium]